MNIAGVDEAGRGAWAGPVVAAAVILPSGCVSSFPDSKQLSLRQRMLKITEIQDQALAWGIGVCSHGEIDHLGILPATMAAMRRAVRVIIDAGYAVDAVLVDGLQKPGAVPVEKAEARADDRYNCVGAASILAKVSRDRYMQDCDAWLNGYGFGQHKGYGTQRHQAALDELGISRIHRQSYAPIKNRLQQGTLWP